LLVIELPFKGEQGYAVIAGCIVPHEVTQTFNIEGTGEALQIIALG